MTKTKLYAKKTLSVFMAVMMLMTAWVFVAPEKAEAAADVAPATTHATYHVKLTAKFTNIGNSGHIIIYYYPVNSDGTLNTSVRGEYILVNSAAKYSSTTWTFNTADDSTRRLSTDTGAETGPVQGWPCGVKLKSVSSASLTLTGLTIGNKSVVLNGGSWGAGSGNTKEVLYNNTGSGWTGYLDWPVPAVSSVRSAPTAQTISIANGSAASKTFTATFNDQYGVQWPSTSGITAALDPQLDSANVTVSGNTATVTGNMFVFNNAGYNSANGQIKTKLNIMQGGKTASCDVTFQAPKLSAYLKYINGTIAKTYSSIGYYKQSVTLTNLPDNTSPTPIDGNDDYHQTYQWPATARTSFSLDSDKTFNEEKATLAAHNYGDWSESGDNHVRTCSVCGYVQTQAHIKNPTGGYVTKEETCTENGVMTYDCAVCGKKAIETSVINNITGHNFKDIAIKEYGKDGTHWRKCTRCDTYGWDGVENACEAHDWDKNNDGKVDANDSDNKASTCKEHGYEKYTCEVCSATWEKTLDLAKHTITATPAKDVSNICGDEGNVAFWTCSVCGRIWKDEALTDELIDKTDADSDGIPDALETKGPKHEFTGTYVSVTPGKDGTHKRQCTRFAQCKAYGPEEKHDWGEPAVTSATCTATGKEVYTCKLCPQTYEVELKKAAHKMTKIVAVAPECGKAGNNEYYSCSTCGKFYKDEAGTTVTTEAAETLAALEHKWTAHHEYDTLNTPATCMDAAVYNNHCDYCKVELKGATHFYGDPDTVNGHNFNGEIQKNADGTHSYKCTVDGCDEYGKKTTCTFTNVKEDVPSTCKTTGYIIYECTTCKAEKREEKTAYDFDNHTGGTEVRGKLDAKCNANGYTGDTHCLGCDTIIEKGKTITADPKVHPHANMKPYDAKPSTCQDAGYSAYKYCDQCGTYEIEKVPGTLKAHKFTKYVTNNDGTHTAICDTCADGTEKATDLKDCTGGKANCVDKAVCDVCNAPYGEVDSSNHKTVELAERVEPTCQTEGRVAYQYCDACGENIDNPTPIEKKPHVFGEWTKIDGEDKHTRSCTTCKADVGEGIVTQTEDCNGGTAYCNALAQCKDCKASYGELDKTNHKTQANYLDGAYDATCQKEGFTGNYLYECCNAVKQAGETIPKKDHVFDIEVENSRVDATCIAEGEVTYKCSTCVETADVKAATDKKVIPVNANNHATPNETVTVGKKAATCEEDGHTGDVYYKCCYDEEASASENRKALKEKGTTIKANGQHVYGDAIPEYMIERIDETKDADGNVTSRTIVLKTEAPDYDAMVEARRDDDKWYHFEQCTICGVITETACYTYEHTYNCVDTDKCEVCKGLCSLKDADKHIELIKIEKVEATHTTDGTKAYYQCSGCKKYFLDDAGKKGFDPATEEGKALIAISKDTVPCTGWEEKPFETKDPTCGNDGYKKYHCIVEGCTKVKTEVIPATSDSHEWGTEYVEIKAPTCGSVGYEALYCTKCDAIKPNSTVTIAATGEHVYKLVGTQEGTSCKDPTKEYYECEGCGKEKTETVYDGAAEHDWTEWVTTGGDCASGIIQERECKECGEKERKTESTDAHSFELVLRVEPTVEKDGYEIYKCTNCELEERKELPYEGETPEAPEDKHVVNEEKYTVVKPADCEHGEIRRYICLSCGETVEKEIGEPAEHVWLLQKAEMATCTADGHREYYRCVRCLGVYEDGKGEIKIEKLGHDDKNSDGKCDRCNATFYGEGECGCICHKENGFMQLIYKILRFFWKLFKIGRSCDCGAVHY